MKRVTSSSQLAGDLLHVRPPQLEQLACRDFRPPAETSVPVTLRILEWTRQEF